jgi:hypothetical protein
MTNLAFAIALQALWQEWARAYIVLAQSPKKERATRKWFASNPRVIDRALAQKPYNFI